MKHSGYQGPPTCRNRATWLEAPFCDGCGSVVEFKLWRDNRRHCSPGCRPAWHLVPAVVCKFPGCGERIERKGGKGRPEQYCSDDCRNAARAEDKRRSRAGLPSIETELKGNRAAFADWMPSLRDMEENWTESFLILDEYGFTSREEESDWGLDRWLKYGGDWPGMVAGLNRPAVRDGNEVILKWNGNRNPRRNPALGSWKPWNDPSL